MCLPQVLCQCHRLVRAPAPARRASRTRLDELAARLTLSEGAAGRSASSKGTPPAACRAAQARAASPPRARTRACARPSTPGSGISWSSRRHPGTARTLGCGQRQAAGGKVAQPGGVVVVARGPLPQRSASWAFWRLLRKPCPRAPQEHSAPSRHGEPQQRAALTSASVLSTRLGLSVAVAAPTAASLVQPGAQAAVERLSHWCAPGARAAAGPKPTAGIADTRTRGIHSSELEVSSIRVDTSTPWVPLGPPDHIFKDSQRICGGSFFKTHAFSNPQSSAFIALGTPAGPRATRPATCRL